MLLVGVFTWQATLMRVVPNMTHDHDPDHMTTAGNKTSPVRCDRRQIAPRLPVAEASQRAMSSGMSRLSQKVCCVFIQFLLKEVLLENSVFVTNGRWGSRVYSARCLRAHSRGSPYLTQPAEASTFVFELSFEGV